MSETQNFDGEMTPPTRTKCGGWIRYFFFHSGNWFRILPLDKEVLPVVAVENEEDVFAVGVAMISFVIEKNLRIQDFNRENSRPTRQRPNCS